MATLPWFAFDLEAYTANTMHLTTEEHGAYLLLMIAYYRTGKPLPGYDRALASITGLTLERWGVIKVALAPFFVEDAGTWKHERIEKELLEASSKHAAAVAKATAAAAARHGKKSSTDAPSKPQAQPQKAPSRKRTSSQPVASSEDAPSKPQAGSSSPHLHKHTTLSDERVVGAAPNDDDPKDADAIGKEENPLGTTLPADWIPGVDEMTAAYGYGMTDTNIEAELLTFHAYNAQHGTFSKNWSATWALWCARWKEREAAKPKQPAPRIEVNNAPTDANWESGCKLWVKSESMWPYRLLGPAPGQLGCRCPPKFLTKYHIDPATGRVATPSETES